MTREERELARLLITDPIVRGWVTRAARIALFGAILATFLAAVVVLMIGGPG